MPGAADIGEGWSIEAGPCYQLVPAMEYDASWLDGAFDIVAPSLGIDFTPQIPETVGWTGYTVCLDYLVLDINILGIDLDNIVFVLAWVMGLAAVFNELRS